MMDRVESKGTSCFLSAARDLSNLMLPSTEAQPSERHIQARLQIRLQLIDFRDSVSVGFISK